MTLGTILVLIGIILAVVSAFVPQRHLLTAAVVLIGIGVLAGVGAITA